MTHHECFLSSDWARVCRVPYFVAIDGQDPSANGEVTKIVAVKKALAITRTAVNSSIHWATEYLSVERFGNLNHLTQNMPFFSQNLLKHSSFSQRILVSTTKGDCSWGAKLLWWCRVNNLSKLSFMDWSPKSSTNLTEAMHSSMCDIPMHYPCQNTFTPEDCSPDVDNRAPIMASLPHHLIMMRHRVPWLMKAWICACLCTCAMHFTEC